MLQQNKYIVQNLGTESVNVLVGEDLNLISTKTLTDLPFYPKKYTVDLNFYDFSKNLLESHRDITSYSVLGAVQGAKVNRITVDPVADCESYNYRGDVIVGYEIFNNLFSPSKDADSNSLLFIAGISSNRTEVRAKSTTISSAQLKTYADALYEKLNSPGDFPAVFLDFPDSSYKAVVLNVLTEVLDGEQYVTFKLYQPLPTTLGLKSRFTVIEQVGEPVLFKVIREVEILPEKSRQLRGPNFNLDSEKPLDLTTGYLNCTDLLSYPVSSSYYELLSLYGDDCAQLSIDHSDFSQFVHFSSAAERLENFRYKLSLIGDYESSGSSGLLPNYKDRIEGILSNFDHYERYLYFESGSACWPKLNEKKPYINLSPTSSIAETWWDQEISRAQAYDENNPDILVGAIPPAIRENPENEPFLIFVHMIGQHFDSEWIYAKAVADRYKADNRLDYGISKDLVKHAIEDFGLDLYETNQNLDQLFELCNIDGTYNTGSETSIEQVNRISVGLSGHPVPIYIPHTTYDGRYAPPEVTRYILDGRYAGMSGNISGLVTGPATAYLSGSVDFTLSGNFSGYLSGSVGDMPYSGSITVPVSGSRIRGTVDASIEGTVYGNITAFVSGSIYNTIVDAGNANVNWPGGTSWQPMLADTYRKEVYKRIYHNLPFLTKTKGTNRCLRALISCFGIPDEILKIEVTGDVLQSGSKYFGPVSQTTSSLERVQIASASAVVPLTYESGAFVSASTLSEYSPVADKAQARTDMTHEVQIGFSLTEQFDRFAKDVLPDTFDYDDIVGDPRNTGEDYDGAFTNIRNQVLAEAQTSGVSFRSPAAIIRLVRYIDSTLLRTVRDFVPARASVSTGVLVEDNILHRNKYKGLDPKAGNLEEHTGSIETVFIDGGCGGSLKLLSSSFGQNRTVSFRAYGHTITSQYPTVNYESRWSTGNFTGSKPVFDDSPKYDGKLSGSAYAVSDGEVLKRNLFEGKLVDGNPYMHAGNSSVAYTLDFKFLCLPAPAFCNLTVQARNYAARYIVHSMSTATLTYSYLSGSVVYSDLNSTTSASSGYDGGTAFLSSPDTLDGGISRLTTFTEAQQNVGGTSGSVLFPLDADYLELSVGNLASNTYFLGWYKGYIPVQDTGNHLGDFLTAGTTYTLLSGSQQEQYTARVVTQAAQPQLPVQVSFRNKKTGLIRISWPQAFKNAGIGTSHVSVVETAGALKRVVYATGSATDYQRGYTDFTFPELITSDANASLASSRLIGFTSSSVYVDCSSSMQYFYLDNVLWRTGW